MAVEDEEAPAFPLRISLEKICYIIVKARVFDAKVEPAEPDPGSNPSDDGECEILEDYADDPTSAELNAAIDILNEDEIVDLIALAWIGRGDFTELGEARIMARQRHRRRSTPYLVGMPALGDYLEEGLATLGRSCEDSVNGRL